MNISAVTGGTVVTAGGTVRADLLIGGGKVAAIGSAVAGADGRLDATGCYVLARRRRSAYASDGRAGTSHRGRR